MSPIDERFTGFVFKIQANMDPRHRDRVAFVRVCSGRFEKDMTLFNSRVGKPLRASRAYRFFGRDRETISVAYAGDILGLVNPGQFAIGDTLHTGAPLRFVEVPRFPAEHFGRVRLLDQRHKQFDEGLRQLEEEGLMQVFYVTSGRREPIVGVVGALQFDVITSRLRSEYNVEVQVEPAAYTAARWLADPAVTIPPLGGGTAVGVDRQERRVILFASEWEVQYFARQHPASACWRSRRWPRRRSAGTRTTLSRPWSSRQSPERRARRRQSDRCDHREERDASCTPISIGGCACAETVPKRRIKYKRCQVTGW